MFGKSSNAIKAMNDVQRIKNFGGTAKLSYSQIVCLICNSQDAQKNLTAEEFAQFQAVFKNYRAETKCATVDMNGYIQMCQVIIRTFEKYFPYLLVDGEHSENLEIRNQIKIRKLYADGYSFDDALMKYENDYDSIPSYDDYDPINNPKADQIMRLMASFMHQMIKAHLPKANPTILGILSGVADTVYLTLAERYVKDYETEEYAITGYTIITFANLNWSDDQIDTIMTKRREITTKFFETNTGKPNAQIIDTLANYLVSSLSAYNPVIDIARVKATLSNYHQSVFKSLTERFAQCYFQTE